MAHAAPTAGRRRPQAHALAGALLLAVIVAACAGPAGATKPPSAAPSPTNPGPTLTPVPGSVEPTAEPDPPVIAAFEPPAPECPGPADAIEAPRLLASSGAANLVMDEGSSTVQTCSTASSTDVAGDDPTIPLGLAPGEGVIHVALPTGWEFLYWEGWDRAAGGEGANITPGRPTPDRPTAIDVPAPARSGRSIVGISAWVIGLEGRVVAQVSGTILVDAGP